MSLANFEPDYEQVIIKGTRGRDDSSFQVRGLSFHDISQIVRVHYSDLDGLFDLYETSAGQDLSALAAGRFAVRLVSDAPGIVSHIIALAADEEEQLEKVAMLPVLTQYDALQKIARLTFSDVEEVKKIFAQVMEQVGRLKKEGPNSLTFGQNAK
jgi:hypothetical protein